MAVLILEQAWKLKDRESSDPEDLYSLPFSLSYPFRPFALGSILTFNNVSTLNIWIGDTAGSVITEIQLSQWISS